MMAKQSSGASSLPAGYEFWTVGKGGEWLALPRHVIEDILVERQVKDRLKPRVEVLPEKAPEPEPAESAPAGPAWHAAWGAEPSRECHRVLLQFDALHSGAFLEDRQHRSADTDVGKRLKSMVERLVNSGPDRRYARSGDSRAQLESLEREMPHFRAPLRLLKHTLALAEVAPRPVRIPPMLLLGPPGVGKTHFSQRVAELLAVPHAAIGYDQPSAGNALAGTDSHWGNSSTGLLFELLCQGEYANPLILLDELDKATIDSSTHANKPLAELHGVLEPVTARRMADQSVGIQFDASLVTYIATANGVRGIEPSILSRFEVFVIEPPQPREAVETARRVAASALKRIGLEERVRLDPKCHYLLAHLSPRQMLRTVEKAVATAISEKRDVIEEADLWPELGLTSDAMTH
ncbi:MAG: AAA family ATPase [Methylibium sp.]|uniref:AAA family ATPase n=1 Tax=Methylibium sp. TaxID=2067992 RepID=UPI0017BDC104|nr:AAA family ATPase [Methylibium sp.]MBA3599096.1 AAA family ATPase [Methylibium sp.]